MTAGFQAFAVKSSDKRGRPPLLLKLSRQAGRLGIYGFARREGDRVRLEGFGRNVDLAGPNDCAVMPFGELEKSEVLAIQRCYYGFSTLILDVKMRQGVLFRIHKKHSDDRPIKHTNRWECRPTPPHETRLAQPAPQNETAPRFPLGRLVVGSPKTGGPREGKPPPFLRN